MCPRICGLLMLEVKVARLCTLAEEYQNVSCETCPDVTQLSCCCVGGGRRVPIQRSVGVDAVVVTLLVASKPARLRSHSLPTTGIGKPAVVGHMMTWCPAAIYIAYVQPRPH